MRVVVNGELVPNDLVVQEERLLRVQLSKAMPNEPRSVIDNRAREWSRDNVVDQILLRQAVAQDPELIVRLVSKLVPPKSKEITEYYRKNRADFYSPEMVHAMNVVAAVNDENSEESALEQIQAMQKRLAEGADFTSLDGVIDLGFCRRGAFLPDFDAVLFALKPGETSGVIRDGVGFHIVHVRAYRPDGIPELNSIREEVAALLMRQKQRRAVDRYIDQLRLTADIVIED